LAAAEEAVLGRSRGVGAGGLGERVLAAARARVDFALRAAPAAGLAVRPVVAVGLAVRPVATAAPAAGLAVRPGAGLAARPAALLVLPAAVALVADLGFSVAVPDLAPPAAAASREARPVEAGFVVLPREAACLAVRVVCVGGSDAPASDAWGAPSPSAGPAGSADWGRLSLRRWGRVRGSESMTPCFGCGLMMST
jgi:hypothetical protein